MTPSGMERATPAASKFSHPPLDVSDCEMVVGELLRISAKICWEIGRVGKVTVSVAGSYDESAENKK